jgi:hypothetical protein
VDQDINTRSPPLDIFIIYISTKYIIHFLILHPCQNIVLSNPVFFRVHFIMNINYIHMLLNKYSVSFFVVVAG